MALRVLHGHRATLTLSRETLQHVQGRFLTFGCGLNPHPLTGSSTTKRGTDEPLHRRRR